MKLLIVIFAFFCAFASCWSVSSSSSGSSPLAALKHSASSLADHARIVSFWTPQKINEALANTHAGPDVELLSQAEVEAVAALLNQEPHMDEIVYPGLSTRRLQTDSENEDVEILPVSTLAPGNWVTGSYTGKVFFQNSAGVAISCTGVVVPSTYRNMLFTAPQCVYNKTSSTFHKNWAFAPGWDGAPSSFPGTFSVRNGYIPTGYASYTNSSHLLYALGILIANKNDDTGLELEDSTLSPSVRFGGPTTSETRYLIGYSAAQATDKQYYWSGESLSLPLGPSTASGISAQGYNTNPPGAVQWFDFTDAFGGGSVATISSFANSNYPDYSFGTYFGSNLNTFYQNVQAASGPISSTRSRSRSRSRSKTRSKSKSRSKSHSKL